MSRWRRPGAIYAATVRHERTGMICRWGYVGKTRQKPQSRWRQHNQCQPWADCIDGWRVVRSWRRINPIMLGLWEIYYIVTRFPLYNYEWNRHNPRRIPIYVARKRRRTPRYQIAEQRSRRVVRPTSAWKEKGKIW